MGTSLASFRVGGGIVLLLMALSMLRAQPDTLPATENEAMATEGLLSVAVVPLAISTVHAWPEWASAAALLRSSARYRTPLSTLR